MSEWTPPKALVEAVARDINAMIANLAHPVGMGLGMPEKAAQAVAVIALTALPLSEVADALAAIMEVIDDDDAMGAYTMARIARAKLTVPAAHE